MLDMHGVVGSIPTVSTIKNPFAELQMDFLFINPILLLVLKYVVKYDIIIR